MSKIQFYHSKESNQPKVLLFDTYNRRRMGVICRPASRPKKVKLIQILGENMANQDGRQIDETTTKQGQTPDTDDPENSEESPNFAGIYIMLLVITYIFI